MNPEVESRELMGSLSGRSACLVGMGKEESTILYM